MSRFIFENYDFDATTGRATFRYGFDDGRRFEEVVHFKVGESYNADALGRALRLAHLVAGTSYLKTFPTTDVEAGVIDEWSAAFLNQVYQEGLSQFVFENNLTRAEMPHFTAQGEISEPVAYEGQGILALQSGGKDSLLTAQLLTESGTSFTPWYLASSEHHPAVLDELGEPLEVATRVIDRDALHAAAEEGARNGHVPVTYIVQSYALIQAILLGKNEVLVSIAHEGEEPHAVIGDLQVTHQWSKTWQAEQLFADYVRRFVSPDIHIGSPLRGCSELKVARLFVEHAWQRFGHRFSSCNRANYRQGEDNSELHWCGECPKCANAFLLFAPYVDAPVLTELFAGQDLFAKPLLQDTFKGLLSVEGVMKPFECIGEVDELRFAYHQAQAKGGYAQLSFDVPPAQFDPERTYPAQDWAQL